MDRAPAVLNITGGVTTWAASRADENRAPVRTRSVRIEVMATGGQSTRPLRDGYSGRVLRRRLAASLYRLEQQFLAHEVVDIR